MRGLMKLFLLISSAGVVLALSTGCGNSSSGGAGGSAGTTSGGTTTGNDTTTTTSSGISCSDCVCCSSDLTPGMHYTCPTSDLASQACSGGTPPSECIAGDGACP